MTGETGSSVPNGPCTGSSFDVCRVVKQFKAIPLITPNSHPPGIDIVTIPNAVSDFLFFVMRPYVYPMAALYFHSISPIPHTSVPVGQSKCPEVGCS